MQSATTRGYCIKYETQWGTFDLNNRTVYMDLENANPGEPVYEWIPSFMKLLDQNKHYILSRKLWKWS